MFVYTYICIHICVCDVRLGPTTPSAIAPPTNATSWWCPHSIPFNRSHLASLLFTNTRNQSFEIMYTHAFSYIYKYIHVCFCVYVDLFCWVLFLFIFVCFVHVWFLVDTSFSHARTGLSKEAHIRALLSHPGGTQPLARCTNKDTMMTTITETSVWFWLCVRLFSKKVACHYCWC